jgi:hypothetical protein
MKRSATGVLLAMLVGLGGAGLATAAPVTKIGTVPCDAGYPTLCAVDSYEVRCTEKAQRLAIRLKGQSHIQMTAVITSPASMAGTGRRAGTWGGDTEETRVFRAPSSIGALMKALVVVMGDPLGSDGWYQLTASCYSYTGSPGEDPDDGVAHLAGDPDPEDPDENPTPESIKTNRGTAITELQDQ